jgi:hypothetical protein
MFSLVDDKGRKKVIRITAYDFGGDMLKTQGLGKAKLLPKAVIFLPDLYGATLKLLLTGNALPKLRMFPS